MEKADILISGDYVVTVDETGTVIRDGAVAVRCGRIVAVGPRMEVEAAWEADETGGGPGTVIFPGLVNAHTHAAMVYFRGMADDLPLKTWLEEHIWPAEAAWLGDEFVGDAVELAAWEMLRSGITAFNDMYFYGDAIARAAKRIGIRAVVGAGILDFPSKVAGSTEEYLERARDLITGWKGDDLIVPADSPHAPYTCSPGTYDKARELAEQNDVPLHTHLAETEWEVDEIRRRYGKSPVALLSDREFLSPRVCAAHAVWVSEEEIVQLAETGTAVAHCPESNLKLASGIAPVAAMLKAGVRVALGTDGAASNNNLNMLEEMSTAAKLQKAAAGDPTVVDARTALRMATIEGARALGLGDLTGSLEPGKSADLVVADLDRPHLVPLYDICSQIVYAMEAGDVRDVMVAGRFSLRNRRLVNGDEDHIRARAAFWREKIRPGA